MEAMGQDQGASPLALPAVIASNPSFLCVTAKSPKACAQFVLPEASTVREFKEEISKHFSCEPHQLVLVFFGRILKDQDTLRQCGVSDGMTVHLLIRSLKTEQEGPPQPSYGMPRTSTCAPQPADCSPTPSSVLGSWPPPERPLLPTSEMIVQKVRQVILANPEVQQLARQMPAIGHILNHRGIMRVILEKMREIVELAKSPEAIQEQKGPGDQALASLQSNTPGGDNPLRQLDHSDAQETVGPDLFAPSSPYATLAGDLHTEHLALSSQEPPMESQEGGGTLPLSSAPPSLWTHGRDEDGPFNTLPGPRGLSPPPTSVAEPLGVVGGVPAPEAARIPQLVVSLCHAYAKRLLSSLLQEAFLGPEGRGPPAQPEHLQQQVQHFSEQMQSPEVVAAMSNPRALQAWAQMEQGLQGLLAEAPVLIPWFVLRLRGLGHSAAVRPWPSETPGQGSAATE
ncbi:hypothetical protein JRQ81_019619 [Phrynocephalus forsythii]|uniref:Ubiquitin-like domain-containing protein n=1 Tax=Phrynocephalus forsythii TaxID=171643 RepID=A0A9Q1AYH1_9SAUR|nr:hypothetical protein JRQ81_019619 [Phrynocephalus forsythii]